MTSKFLKFSGKKTSALSFAVLAGLAVVLSASAAGPVFDTFPIAYSGAQNTDYPLIDGRDVTANGQYSTSQADHDDGITANAGDTLEFIIYYHNGAADAPENTAQNVRARATLSGGTGNSFSVGSSISADNASAVNSSSRGGDMAVKVSGASQTLEYIPGSTVWYPERSATGQSLPDGLFSGSGVSLGNIRGCWNFSGYVKFRLRVGSSAATTPTLQITKTVATSANGTFADSVSVEPSSTVYFRVVTRAINANAAGVVIRDLLPSGLIYASNTTKVNGTVVSDSAGFFGSGYSYGALQKDQSVEINFAAQVASASFFSSGQTTLTNTANARGDNVATVQDTASVAVSGSVAGSSFALSKSAYNQTQGLAAQSVLANAGDVINYILTYRNTGAVTISNAVIEDDLSDILKLADVINTGEGQMSGNTIRFPAVSVPAGVSVDKTFQVRVRDVASGTADLTMTNIYGNQVDIQVRPPTVKGAYIAPKTGPKENVVFFLALLVTAAFYIYRKYPQWKAKRVAGS